MYIYRTIIIALSLFFVMGMTPLAAEDRKGLQIKGWIGGWEPDYTRKGYETMFFYDGLNRLDLYAGYSYSDQVYYNRKKIYASGYYFYRPDSYLKLYLAQKDYDYPVDPSVQKPNPDSNSYDKVPAAELEVSHWFVKSLRGTLAYEYFKPSFFYDKDTTAENQKISAEVYYLLPVDFLKAKVIYANLRDPDPNTTEIKGRDNLKTSSGTATTTDIRYQTSSLLGGAVEFERDQWSAELKYLPNRDLDNSYKYSFLTGVGYELNPRLSTRLDYVYDKYSAISNFAGETAKVYRMSALYELNERVDLGVGYKHIHIPRGNENTGFLSLSYKTGLVF
ncbi:MAG: hypothetical protein HZC13_06625 [Nitrospirae bacterium]|nr:hypothetical protein [Nitrospirota bacterium]